MILVIYTYIILITIAVNSITCIAKNTIIKEHIRGLQEFEWAGYQCNVISPKLQAKTAASFTLPSEDVEVDDDTSNIVYLSKLGKVLADSEERRSA
jgi:hypothetical protein